MDDSYCGIQEMQAYRNTIKISGCLRLGLEGKITGAKRNVFKPVEWITLQINGKLWSLGNDMLILAVIITNTQLWCRGLCSGGQ